MTLENKASLINENRPPAFCPGCGHDRVVKGLDQALVGLGLKGDQVALVSDIGCSGLFDTFFNTHAFHGLHGRALTYAAGIKLASPETTVIATMGDGGLGIGGAHVLSACRRNVDMTLLVLNNFNFGMTGGQFSATTPPDAQVGSAFLNRLEKPVDIGQVAAAAGATYVRRCSAYDKNVVDYIKEGIEHKGFAVLDLWNVCTGRFVKRNKINPKLIEERMSLLPPLEGEVEANARPDYASVYAEEAGAVSRLDAPVSYDKQIDPPSDKRQEVLILGSAGQRVVTAGELICLAGLSAGLHATQKSEYNITVLRGPSVAELILSPNEIDYTGITAPTAVLALAKDGVIRRKAMFADLSTDCVVLKAADVDIPETAARVREIDFKALKIKDQDRSLAGLAMLAAEGETLTTAMLDLALGLRFKGAVLESARALVAEATA